MPDARPLPGEPLGDADPTETAPDPESPLREPDAATLPEVAVGEDAVDRVIQGHTYDGIREYDNPMPGWWVAIFWATVAFAPVYMLGVHVFDWIDDYGDDFAEAGAELAEIRAVYAATGPAFKTDPGALREYASDAQMAAAGAEPFAAICAACHGQQGEGVIGPNLADAYWLYGAEPEEVWTSIAEGFPTAGMPPMKDQLGEEERAQVLAYVYSLQGTDPPNAKGPEGDLVQM
jgi:cytochrome c oxidase cbb3-type subunit 3